MLTRHSFHCLTSVRTRGRPCHGTGDGSASAPAERRSGAGRFGIAKRCWVQCSSIQRQVKIASSGCGRNRGHGSGNLSGKQESGLLLPCGATRGFVRAAFGPEVTPVVLHHYPKKHRDGDVERIIREAFYLGWISPNPRWLPFRAYPRLREQVTRWPCLPYDEGGTGLCHIGLTLSSDFGAQYVNHAGGTGAVSRLWVIPADIGKGARVSAELISSDFPAFYRALNKEFDPFPWQDRLAKMVCKMDMAPDHRSSDGSGKTSCIDIALFAMAIAGEDLAGSFS